MTGKERALAKVVANGVRLNVTDIPSRRKDLPESEQTPTVFVHGLAASSAFWFGAGAPFLAIAGPGVLYDLRGHGKSETPSSGYSVHDMSADLIGLIDHYGYQKVNLVAHSFGGMIALLTALKHPDRVASLTLADVRVRPIQTKLSIRAQSIPPALEKRLEGFGINLNTISDSDDGISYLNAVAKIQVAAGDDATEILNTLYRHPRLFKSPRNAMKWIALTENASIVSNLKHETPFDVSDLMELALPMLILAGGESPTLNSAKVMARLCPHAIFHEIPGVGHFFPVSAPKLFVRPTLRFLRAVNRNDPRLLSRQNAGHTQSSQSSRS